MKHKNAIAILAAMLVAGTASAQGFPKLKAGLWESTTKSDQKGQTFPQTLMCIDDSVIEPMMKLSQGIAQGFCSKNESSTSGNKIIGSAECKLANSTIRSTSVTTIDNENSNRTETKAVYDPPLYGIKEATTTIERKYIGACKPGMKPGDMSVGGATMNILDMTRAGGVQKK